MNEIRIKYPGLILTVLFTKPPAPYSMIHKAASLIVPGCSLELTDTIPPFH